MAARDRYKVEVVCPGCGSKGVLHISEDDYPFMRKLHRAVDRTEGGFTAEADHNGEVSVACACGHKGSMQGC